jgi:hypothetical protein
MGKIYSMHGQMTNGYKISMGNPLKKDYLGDLAWMGRIILKCILKQQAVKM